MRKPMIAFLCLCTATAATAQDRPVAKAIQATASYTFDLTPAPDDRQAVLIRVIAGHEQFFLRDMDTGAERQMVANATTPHSGDKARTSARPACSLHAANPDIPLPGITQPSCCAPRLLRRVRRSARSARVVSDWP